MGYITSRYNHGSGAVTKDVNERGWNKPRGQSPDNSLVHYTSTRFEQVFIQFVFFSTNRFRILRARWVPPLFRTLQIRQIEFPGSKWRLYFRRLFNKAFQTMQKMRIFWLTRTNSLNWKLGRMCISEYTSRAAVLSLLVQYSSNIIMSSM